MQKWGLSLIVFQTNTQDLWRTFYFTELFYVQYLTSLLYFFSVGMDVQIFVHKFPLAYGVHISKASATLATVCELVPKRCYLVCLACFVVLENFQKRLVTCQNWRTSALGPCKQNTKSRYGKLVGVSGWFQREEWMTWECIIWHHFHWSAFRTMWLSKSWDQTSASSIFLVHNLWCDKCKAQTKLLSLNIEFLG